MRVLHVIQPTDGGSALATADLAVDQARAGDDVVVACPDGDLVDALAAAGVPRLAWRARREPGAFVAGEWWRLRALLREVRPDVVFVHATKAGLVGRLALRGRVPTVYQPHGWGWRQCTGMKRRLVVAWERFACRWTDTTVCVGESERDEAVALGLRSGWDVVPNGLDLVRFEAAGAVSRDTARSRLGLGSGSVAVCVSRLSALKGHEVLLDAWGAVEGALPGTTLVLVGDGPLRPALEAAAPSSVRFAGSATTAEVLLWLRACDVAVQPSMTEAGISLALLEAMALGRSVVATDIGDTRGLLEASRCGAAVPAGDAAALADALELRLADADLAGDEGDAGRVAAARFGRGRRHGAIDAIVQDVMRRRFPWATQGWGDRLRVTIVFTAGVLGGAERWALDLLDATDRLDATAVVLGPGGPLRQELERRGVPVETVASGATPAALVCSAHALAHVLKRRRPDVVLANGSKAALCAVVAGLRAQVRVVWARHDFARDRLLGRRLARRVDAVVASSQALLDTIGASGSVITPARPALQPDTREEAEAFWALQEPGLIGAGRTAAIVGRVDAFKGHDSAIGALASSRAAGWRLAVVGDDDPSDPGATARLRRLAADLGVADRVIFCGAVPDAGRHLGAFDAVVVATPPPPSGREAFGGEGYGIVVMEALLAGVPVVCDPSVPAAALVPAAVEPLSESTPEAVAAALAAVSSRAAEAAVTAGDLWERLPPAALQADRLASVLAATAARSGAGNSTRPPVSIITTVLNEGAGIEKLVRTVLGQAGPDDELVVVDGGSTDDTAGLVAAIAETDARVTLVVAPGLNIAAGRNLAVRTARNEVVVTTDGGCEQDPGWLDAMAAPFAGAATPGLVLGTYLPSTATPLDAAMTCALYPVPAEAGHPSPWSRLYSRFLGLAYDPTLPTGRTSAFTVAAWEDAGGYPTHLYAAEDVTFGRAVAAAGHGCELTTDARVRWSHRDSLRGTARMFYVYGVGDGRSGDPLLLARDAIRAGAYLGGTLLACRGGRGGRILVAAGAALYVSLPVLRTRSLPSRGQVVARIPLVLAVQDLAKAAGAAAGIWGRLRGVDRQASGGSVADRPAAASRAPEAISAPLQVTAESPSPPSATAVRTDDTPFVRR